MDLFWCAGVVALNLLRAPGLAMNSLGPSSYLPLVFLYFFCLYAPSRLDSCSSPSPQWRRPYHADARYSSK